MGKDNEMLDIVCKSINVTYGAPIVGQHQYDSLDNLKEFEYNIMQIELTQQFLDRTSTQFFGLR